MPELLDFDKDLIHLEAASKVWLERDHYSSNVVKWLFSLFFVFQSMKLFGQIQLKSLAEEMQSVSKGLEKVEKELSESSNDGAIAASFQKVKELRTKNKYEIILPIKVFVEINCLLLNTIFQISK